MRNGECDSQKRVLTDPYLAVDIPIHYGVPVSNLKGSRRLLRSLIMDIDRQEP